MSEPTKVNSYVTSTLNDTINGGGVVVLLLFMLVLELVIHFGDVRAQGK